MIMINTAYPNRFYKTTGGISQLREAIRQKPELLPFERVLVRSLQGIIKALNKCGQTYWLW